MRTDLINNVVDEGIYQLQYYKNLYLIHERINKILLIFIICLIVFLVYYYLKF